MNMVLQVVLTYFEGFESLNLHNTSNVFCGMDFISNLLWDLDL